MKLDGSRVEHITNTYGRGPVTYDGEAHAVPSPDGMKVLWATEWNGQINHGASFVVDIRDRCP